MIMEKKFFKRSRRFYNGAYINAKTAFINITNQKIWIKPVLFKTSSVQIGATGNMRAVVLAYVAHNSRSDLDAVICKWKAYRKIYSSSPLGWIRIRTLGTVTNWKFASFAFGKKTSGFQIALTRFGSAKSRASVMFEWDNRGSNHLCLR